MSLHGRGPLADTYSRHYWQWQHTPPAGTTKLNIRRILYSTIIKENPKKSNIKKTLYKTVIQENHNKLNIRKTVYNTFIQEKPYIWVLYGACRGVCRHRQLWREYVSTRGPRPCKLIPAVSRPRGPTSTSSQMVYTLLIGQYKSCYATGFTQVNTLVTYTKYRRKDGIFAAVSTPISTAAG